MLLYEGNDTMRARGSRFMTLRVLLFSEKWVSIVNFRFSRFSSVNLSGFSLFRFGVSL